MIDKRKIFRKGSTTYFFSSIFFPAKIREKVFTLYAFVRIADNFVDTMPQQSQSFKNFVSETEMVWAGHVSRNLIISDFVLLAKQIGIKKVWVDAFFKAMAMDIEKAQYQTFEELEEYMYGSAEVIGLMMAKILDLPEQSLASARLQGKAMQLINFIRDVKEDTQLNRVYLPIEDQQKFGIQKGEALYKNEQKFCRLLRFEIERYLSIQQQAEKGYKYIPYMYKIPIKTAADMYNWTAQKIYKDPTIVFYKKLKPSPGRVILQIIKNSLNI